MKPLRRATALLIVSDIEASVRFYCEGLGFSLVDQWRPDEQLRWCFLQDGEATLMLQQALEDEDPPASTWGKGVVLFFICDDVDARYAELTRRHLEATAPRDTSYGMRQTFLRDPDSYELCFQSAVSEDG